MKDCSQQIKQKGTICPWQNPFGNWPKKNEEESENLWQTAAPIITKISAVCRWTVTAWCWKRFTAETPCAVISGRACCPMTRNWMHPCRALLPSGASTAENLSLQMDEESTAPTDAEMSLRKRTPQHGFGSIGRKQKGPNKVEWTLLGEEVPRNERSLPLAAGWGIWSLYRRCNDLI